MRDIIEYGGFIGTVHFSTEDECFFGKIEGIDDLVTFEGSTVNEIKKSFKASVEDYLDLCKRHKKKLFKSYKGSLNIRLSSDLHLKALQQALMQGISLNQFIQIAVEKQFHNR